jgi:predicted NAD/FAD-dependent oxidoreductase
MAQAHRRGNTPLGADQRVAVIGAGVAACALAAALRRGGWGGALSLWESGRGPGGRAASRRSRQDAELCLDHGAPLLSITGDPAPALLDPLLRRGVVMPWSGSIRGLDGEGRLTLTPDSPYCRGRLFHSQGGMDNLCRGLLELAERDNHGSIDGHFGALVPQLRRLESGGWQLLDAAGSVLAEADWLLLSSTLLAHPRSRLLLNWPEVPLQQALRLGPGAADPRLDHALAAIASLRSEARSNLLLVASGANAAAWEALPFRLLEFDAAASQRWGLQRVSVQPFAPGRCALVAHSTATFAAEHLSVYGSRSSIATLLGIPPRPEQEAAVVDALSEALAAALAGWLRPDQLAGADRQLMRWGAAFPLHPGLPAPLQLCPASRVGFCGDYVEVEGFGRIEGALRSGESLAAALLAPVLSN